MTTNNNQALQLVCTLNPADEVTFDRYSLIDQSGNQVANSDLWLDQIINDDLSGIVVDVLRESLREKGITKFNTPLFTINIGLTALQNFKETGDNILKDEIIAGINTVVEVGITTAYGFIGGATGLAGGPITSVAGAVSFSYLANEYYNNKIEPAFTSFLNKGYDYLFNSDSSTKTIIYDKESSVTYEVKAGDTLSSIAQALGTTVETLKQANPWLESEGRISDDGKYVLIKPGEKLSLNASDITNSVNIQDATITNQNGEEIETYTNFFLDQANDLFFTSTELDGGWQINNNLSNLANTKLEFDFNSFAIQQITGISDKDWSGAITINDSINTDSDYSVADPDIFNFDENISLSPDEYRSFLSGNIDDFKNIAEFESDLNLFKQACAQLQSDLFSSLEYERQAFIEEFNDSLQQFMEDSPTDWLNRYADFSLHWQDEWEIKVSNLLSAYESNISNLVVDYQFTYYDPAALDISYIEGCLKSDYFDGSVDWDFRPDEYEGYIEGFGYYELADAFDIQDTDYTEYWSHFDYDDDGLISDEEYIDDFGLFYELYSENDRFYKSIYAFDYEAEEFGDYWYQFDCDDNGLISEEEFCEDWNAFISYLEENGYYVDIWAFDYGSLSSNGSEYFEQFDNNGDGLIDENEFEGDEDDYREWAIDSFDGYEIDYNPYDEIDWQEYEMMSDSSPWESPEEAFEEAHNICFDEYYFLNEEKLESAFNDTMATNFDEYWLYVEDYYNMEDYWGLEIVTNIIGFQTDYSQAVSDQLSTLNSVIIDNANFNFAVKMIEETSLAANEFEL